jgi:hypothetical protein
LYTRQNVIRYHSSQFLSNSKLTNRNKTRTDNTLAWKTFSTGRLSWVVLNSRLFFSVQVTYFFEFPETSWNHLRNLALYYFHLFICCLFMCERSRKVHGTVHLLLLKEADRGMSHLIIAVFHNVVFFLLKTVQLHQHRIW